LRKLLETDTTVLKQTDPLTLETQPNRNTKPHLNKQAQQH
jgi:hypothetical protein